MAEIQEAAEIITNAVSPDANIIFGTTLKPEMEDELVITVIATGFDSEAFHLQEVSLDQKPAPVEQPASEQVDEEMVKNIDMELGEADAAETFASEDETNIWTEPQEDEEDYDTPAFLRRRKKKKE